MNRLIPLLSFSLLLLVPIPQSTFANHPTIPGCPSTGFSSIVAAYIPNKPTQSSLILRIPVGVDACIHTLRLDDPNNPPLFCNPPYVAFNSIKLLGAPLRDSYSACITSLPANLQITDITHPHQCQGASVLINNHCFAEALGSMIGGTLLEIYTMALLVGAIGTNPIITGLIGSTLAGVVVQTVWFVHIRRKSKNS